MNYGGRYLGNKATARFLKTKIVSFCEQTSRQFAAAKLELEHMVV